MLNQPMEDPHLPELRMIRGELGSLRNRISDIRAMKPQEPPGGPKAPIFQRIEDDLQEMQDDVRAIRADLHPEDPDN